MKCRECGAEATYQFVCISDIQFYKIGDAFTRYGRCSKDLGDNYYDEVWKLEPIDDPGVIDI